MGAAEENITAHLPARAWVTIAAEVDNAVSLAVANDNEEVVRIGSRIRQAGWDQAQRRPRSAASMGAHVC
jgi:hypothetical protein